MRSTLPVPRLISVAAAAVVLLTAGTTLAAAPNPELRDGAYCAAGADPMIAGQPQPVEFDCFPTEEAVLEFITGEDVPADVSGVRDELIEELNDAVLDTAPNADAVADRLLAVAAVAQPVLGVEFADSSLTGTPLYLYANSGNGCGSGSTYGFPNLGAWGFNDRVSSATAYLGCRSQHYRDSGYTGTSTTCSPTCWSMGTMNDTTTSIVFRP